MINGGVRHNSQHGPQLWAHDALDTADFGKPGAREVSRPGSEGSVGASSRNSVWPRSNAQASRNNANAPESGRSS